MISANLSVLKQIKHYNIFLITFDLYNSNFNNIISLLKELIYLN